MHVNEMALSQKNLIRSDVFNGILAAHIFPSLADVLTDPLGTDDFGPLDLSLHAMEDTSTDIYSRSLAEEDFLNPNAMAIGSSDITEETETAIQELTTPGDLLVRLPLWAEGSDDIYEEDCEVGLIEYEVMASTENTEPPCYPHSPGSVGDMSDYSSDCSAEPGTDVYIEDTMIEMGKPDIKMHSETMLSQIPPLTKVKIEPRNLPDESILRTNCYSPFDDSKRNLSELQYDEEDSTSDSSIKADEKSKRKRPGRKKGQTSSVYHLWEFIRDMLHNPQHCPKIIKWEDEDEGIFRVIKSTEVAKQWGSMKKNKTKMTYEKLSRSLRYSRKEGYFDELPKDRGFPKKLCFKFGPKSHGWKK